MASVPKIARCEMWLALSLRKKATISLGGTTKDLPISDMASGCVGCLLVFDTKESAADYVGLGGKIIEVEIEVKP